MPLVWNGTQFETEGGSDTEESDSEQPLDESQQVQAILYANYNNLPPLPVLEKHAQCTASAVVTCIGAIPTNKRTIAHDHVIMRPRVPRHTPPTIADWIEEQLDDRRTERTIRAAMISALNPKQSVSWVGKKAKSNPGNVYIARGMAYDLRCHPFTRSDVQRGLSMVHDLCAHREERNRARMLMRQRNAASLDAAVVLVGFHSVVRHFNAHRYPYVI